MWTRFWTLPSRRPTRVWLPPPPARARMARRSSRWSNGIASVCGGSVFDCWATSTTRPMRPRMFSCDCSCRRKRFAGDSKYATWVHAIAVRTCLALRRGRGRRQRHETAAADTARPEHARASRPATGLKLDLTQMLETLDEEDRAMILLKYSEGYSYEELAPIFELSSAPAKCESAGQATRFSSNSAGNDATAASTEEGN